MEVPRKLARVISRTKPIMREARVITESTSPDFKSDLDFSFFDMINKE